MQTRRYLLTGAGFSKSFGGWLCNELTKVFFSSLVKEPTMQQDIVARFRTMGFEEILTEIRAIYPEGQKMVMIF